MSPASPILQTTLADRRPDRQGKVRDIYDFGNRLLIVATDRISAFDYVLGSGIPDKGKVLTQISSFWFDRTAVDRRRITCSRPTPASYPGPARSAQRLLRGRSMLVTAHRTAADRVRRARLPVRLGLEGLRRHRRAVRHHAADGAARIRPPAAADLHAGDQGDRAATTSTSPKRKPPNSSASACSIASRDLTLRLYAEGSAHAESCGIIVADTKFEFGLLPLETSDAGRSKIGSS